MKYIETYESAYSDMMRKLRNKFIGKYTIIKGIPGIEWEFTQNKFFMIYIVPGSWSGPINQEYTALIVAAYKNTLTILIEENKIKNKIPADLVITISLNELSKIALYTSKNYDECIEKLTLINSITKYNL